MKYLITIACMILTICAYCCFMQDPHEWLTKTTILPTDNVEVEFPVVPAPQGYPETWTKPSGWETIQGASIGYDVLVSFPLTINAEFTGFSDGSQVTKMCIYYYDISGKWKLLRKITNPQSVSSNTGDKKSLFGKYVIKDSLGYNNGDIIPVVLYFESVTSSTHNIQNIENGSLKWNGSGIMYLGVIKNVKPI